MLPFVWVLHPFTSCLKNHYALHAHPAHTVDHCCFAARKEIWPKSVRSGHPDQPAKNESPFSTKEPHFFVNSSPSRPLIIAKISLVLMIKKQTGIKCQNTGFVNRAAVELDRAATSLVLIFYGALGKWPRRQIRATPLGWETSLMESRLAEVGSSTELSSLFMHHPHFCKSSHRVRYQKAAHITTGSDNPNFKLNLELN